MAIVKVPEILKETSIFVCYGPFSSLTVRGDGLGFLTYEPITNIQQLKSSDTASGINKYVRGNITPHEKQQLGVKIINGAAKYFPPIKEAELVDIKFGVVRTDGGFIDINAIDKHYKRFFSGVSSYANGLIVNEARKYTFWVRNAEIITYLANIHYCVKQLFTEPYTQETYANIDKISANVSKEIVESSNPQKCYQITQQRLFSIRKKGKITCDTLAKHIAITAPFIIKSKL